jgi:hypothetical protein
LAGTDPRNPSSNLSVTVNVAGGQVHVLFTAQADKAYTVQYKTVLTDLTWQKLVDVAPQAAAHTVDVPDAVGANTQRFYRVITPQQPGAAPQPAAAPPAAPMPQAGRSLHGFRFRLSRPAGQATIPHG